MTRDQQPIAGLKGPNARFAFDLDGGRAGEKRDPLGPILLEPFRRRGGLAPRNNAFDLEPGHGKEIEELLVLQSLGNVDEQISRSTIFPSRGCPASFPADRMGETGGMMAASKLGKTSSKIIVLQRISKESFGGFVDLGGVIKGQTRKNSILQIFRGRPLFGRIAGAVGPLSGLPASANAFG